MAEPTSATYVKVINELSGKVFIPSLILSLLVEFGPAYQAWRDTNLIETYLAFAFLGVVVSGLFFFIMTHVSIRIFGAEEIAPIIGGFIMPIGFIGLFPEHFSGFTVPIAKVTSIAILAWAFFLMDYRMFKTDV